ncbi:hypothetical protein SAMN05192574_105328 [Mucilaginibacter gossypiicola]|uniref:Uncharacterized protein n=1 Tax=Mucilaginibacter gossypiicola TaxID=551995 RepID=A0A1H8M0C1_9SPHI|nr:hypothetical protein [Mucilaginibacter gossypiicola]SEO10720.1 hypothetical protein SAMN05192574_105328 [Mucilaginibacter gossypiicola]
MDNFSVQWGNGHDLVVLRGQNFRMQVDKNRILKPEASGPLYWVSLYREADKFNHIECSYVFEVLSSNAPEKTEIPLFREAIVFYMYAFPNSRNYLMSIPEFSDFYPGDEHWDTEDSEQDYSGLPEPF